MFATHSSLAKADVVTTITSNSNHRTNNGEIGEIELDNELLYFMIACNNLAYKLIFAPL